MSDPSTPSFVPDEESSDTVESVVYALLGRAAKMHASDLFFLTNEDSVTSSVRHLGIIRGQQDFSPEKGRRLISYIKATAGMDIAERRRPGEGRWICAHGNGTRLDLRISTVPTLFGEDLTLRLLDRVHGLRQLDELGLVRSGYNQLVAMLNNPSGLILVTGPTGSGKTSTLYAFLQHLNDGEKKINTLEDPVEYAVPGLRQSQVNLRLGVDFPDLLRSVLRQAPDVIMVGEIRDPVSANIAVRAANSGHLVLATLHAPAAAAALQSMRAQEVPAHFLSTGLLGVVAQRLVRVLCEKCRVTIDLSGAPQTFDEVRPWLSEGEGRQLYGPGRCDACHRTGYAAQTGLFEIMPISRQIRGLIASARPAEEVEQVAIQEGMVNMRRAALLKVAQGVTATEEVFRIVPSEYLVNGC